MEELVVLTRRQAEELIADAVARGIDRLRPLLFKAATEYASEEEVEIRFGLPKRQLAVWRRNGEGPAFVQMENRRPLYRISDVDEWLSRHRVEPENLLG